MKLKKSLLLALAIVIIGINLTGFAAVEAAVINVPGDYGTITEAIDAANPGDTIMVGPGVYYENLYIDKIIRIGSTSGVANTIIDGNVDGNVVLINNTRAIFSGFTVRNSGKLVDDSGVRVINADDSTITHNVIEWTRNGILVEESDNVVVGNNTLYENTFGILYSYTINGTIYLNDVSQSFYGVYVGDSSNSSIWNTTISDAFTGITVRRSNYTDVYGCEIYSCSENGIWMGGWWDGDWWDGLPYRFSLGNTIEHNWIYENGFGISLLFVEDTWVTNNTVSSNHNDGVLYQHSIDG